MHDSGLLRMRFLIYGPGFSYLPQSRAYRVMIIPRSRTSGQVSLGCFINFEECACRGVLTLNQGRTFVEFSCDSRGPKGNARRTVQDGEW